MAEINLSDREARRYSRKTRWFLQRGIDYFDHYRRGALRHWRDHERQPIYTQFPIPFAAPAVPDPAVADENPTITARPDRPFRDIRRRDDTAGGRTVPDDLRRLIESVNFRMVKVLGAGSQGLAVLFESTTDGSKVVFKWSNEVFETAREMWCMRQLVGARHIVQVRFHWPTPKPGAMSSTLVIQIHGNCHNHSQLTRVNLHVFEAGKRRCDTQPLPRQ